MIWRRDEPAPASEPPLRVLFVCLGNLCRSPTAEAVFRHYVQCAGLARGIEIDSAGTHSQAGRSPDKRAQLVAERRGYPLKRDRTRQISERDFEEFDYILAMDEGNLAVLQSFCPEEQQHKVGLLMDYGTRHQGKTEVPDPYFGGPDGFETVVDMVEDAAEGLLNHLRILVDRTSRPLG
jgi:protein-tyrosine phosphatase